MAPFATLYTLSNIVYARAIKALAAAKINGLELVVDPDFQYTVSNKTPEYLSKFPHGKIPALETPSGFLLSESTAIALFLAESGPAKDQLVGRTTEERALVQMWISLSDTDIWINGSAILSPIFGRAKYIPEVYEAKSTEFRRAVQRIEDEFTRSGKKWLVRDDELSLADLSVAGALYWPLKFFVDPEYRAQFPKVMEWWERLLGVKEVAEAFSAPVELCKVKPAMDGMGGPPDSALANAGKKDEDEKLEMERMNPDMVAQVEKSISKEIQCGKCKERTVSYAQAQTRSADEPMTTFCECMNCGNRWKFS